MGKRARAFGVIPMPMGVDYILNILRLKTKLVYRVYDKVQNVDIARIDKNKSVTCVDKVARFAITTHKIQITDNLKGCHSTLVNMLEIFAWKHGLTP
jgi:hypothetical protein